MVDDYREEDDARNQNLPAESERPASAAQPGSVGNYNYAGEGSLDDWEAVEHLPVADEATMQESYYGSYYDDEP